MVNMNTKWTALVLASLVLAAQANILQQVKLNPALISELRSAADGSLSANVNDYVDSTIDMMLPVLQQYGFDPMPLPEVVEGFEVRPLLITYSAWLKIHDGEMTGITKMRRSGDQMVHYFAKMLRVRVVLDFNDLEFRYRYLVQAMGLGPTGGIVATLDSYKVTVDVLLDFNNDELHLQEFSISDIGRLRVRFTGNILTDWLMNPVLNVFIRIFDNVIIRVVEINIRNGVHQAIDFINYNIKTLIDTIESYN